MQILSFSFTVFFLASLFSSSPVRGDEFASVFATLESVPYGQEHSVANTLIRKHSPEWLRDATERYVRTGGPARGRITAALVGIKLQMPPRGVLQITDLLVAEELDEIVRDAALSQLLYSFYFDEVEIVAPISIFRTRDPELQTRLVHQILDATLVSGELNSARNTGGLVAKLISEYSLPMLRDYRRSQRNPDRVHAAAIAEIKIAMSARGLNRRTLDQLLDDEEENLRRAAQEELWWGLGGEMGGLPYLLAELTNVPPDRVSRYVRALLDLETKKIRISVHRDVVTAILILKLGTKAVLAPRLAELAVARNDRALTIARRALNVPFFGPCLAAPLVGLATR